MKHTPEKTTTKFLSSAPMKNVQWSEKHREELHAFFSVFKITDLDHNDRRRIANFVQYVLDDFVSRFLRAKETKRNSLENLTCLYGEVEGRIRYEKLVCRNKRTSGLSPVELFSRRNDLTLEPDQKAEIERALNSVVASGRSVYDWDATICCLLDNGFSDITARLGRLFDLPSGEMESFVIRYGEEEGPRRYEEANQKKRNGLPSTTQYWESLGHTKEEAQSLVLEHQKSSTAERSRRVSGRDDHSVRQIGYWVKLGHSEDEAREKVAAVQRTNTLEAFQSRYGEEEGKVRWKERQEKWMKSMVKSSMVLGSSKIADEMFGEIKKSHHIEQERTIRTKNRVYRVDGVDFDQMKIIEFFGEYWHADPLKYTPSDIVNRMEAQEIWERDKTKIIELQDRGYTVLVIWERDYRNDKKRYIKECLNFLNES